MNQADSIQAYDTLDREADRVTVGAKAPLPLSHLTMTDRFRLYDAACRYDNRHGTFPAAMGEWMLSVGLAYDSRVPSLDCE